MNTKDQAVLLLSLMRPKLSNKSAVKLLPLSQLKGGKRQDDRRRNLPALPRNSPIEFAEHQAGFASLNKKRIVLVQGLVMRVAQ